MFGRSGGPRDAAGFAIVDWKALSAKERKALAAIGVEPAVGDFAFTPGRYYVDGILVENEAPMSHATQSDWVGPSLETGKRYLAYLDVWERHITWIEDDSIREVALGGPDTCTRVKTMWQVKILEDRRGAGENGSDDEIKAQIAKLEEQLVRLNAALESETDPVQQSKISGEIRRVELESSV